MSDPGKESDEQVNATMSEVVIALLKRRYPAARDKSEAVRMSVQDSIDELPDEIVQEALDQ